MSLQIQILCDNPNSWIIPYAKELKSNLELLEHSVLLLFDSNYVKDGDILLLLSCERIFKKLNLNKHNLVVHESALPEGKGWSPLTWQVLEGSNKIPVTLFEAKEKLDAGEIYYQDYIYLNGSELLDEIKHKQGILTQKLILKFIENYPNNNGTPQQGEETFYPKRTEKDSELSMNKTLDEQFNLLRVCDNERYPAFFIKNGIKYKIKIEKHA